jgi:hypothetical protein
MPSPYICCTGMNARTLCYSALLCCSTRQNQNSKHETSLFSFYESLNFTKSYFPLSIKHLPVSDVRTKNKHSKTSSYLSGFKDELATEVLHHRALNLLG